MAFARKRRGPVADELPVADINTTPLIDVMLVLLVMLIITIPIQLHTVDLNLPVGNPPPSDIKPEVVRIDIDGASHVLWNGVAVADESDLKAKLGAAAAQPAQPEIHVRPDRAAKYDAFADVMVAINQAGLQKLGVIGSEQFIDK
ncbi:ExbD/TolR family protein [Derxia gummosa]|uniref:ExbD/TolR family protein n=1 Tax=Derxia gummosa DSM 723 TaxID=1121388 RepID=A0A8B6X9D6_9BURK|nr:biopolymer transporter ExbD [Derxia gummosa]